METPIAEYSPRVPKVKSCTYTLYPDRIEYFAQSPWYKKQQNIPLNTISPYVDTGVSPIRSSIYVLLACIWLIICSAVCLMQFLALDFDLVHNQKWIGDHTENIIYLAVLLVLDIAGFAAGLYFYFRGSRVEWTLLKSDNGQELVPIVRDPRKDAEYHAFLKEVMDRVAQSRK